MCWYFHRVYIPSAAISAVALCGLWQDKNHRRYVRGHKYKKILLYVGIKKLRNTFTPYNPVRITGSPMKFILYFPHFHLSTTVAHNCHIKYKLLTSNTKSWHQIQITHIKYKFLTSKKNYSHQIQNPDIKYKLLTSNTNCSHQIQNPGIKNKIKRSAVGERKLVGTSCMRTYIVPLSPN